MTLTNKWLKISPHKWKHSEGFVIQRMWTLSGKRMYYFLCYWTEEGYHKGNNFASFYSLKEAKDVFKYQEGLSRDQVLDKSDIVTQSYLNR